VSNLLRNIRKSSVEQRIALPHRDGYEFVEISSIIYCQAEGAYTRIFVGEKRNVLISRSLGEIEELLPTEIFQRIHHSTIVNVNYIAQFIRTDGGYLILKTGEKISVSKTRKDLLMSRLGLKKD
jgi:two-component system LytT family response regulator